MTKLQEYKDSEKDIIDNIEIVDSEGDSVAQAYQFEGIDGYFIRDSLNNLFWVLDPNGMDSDEIISKDNWIGKI